MKTLQKRFGSIIAAFAVLGFLTIAPAASVQAATTFPVGEAGIAAYVKLNSISQANFDLATQQFFNSATASSTYMIGIKTYNAADYNTVFKDPIDIHFYLGANGWLVAYLLKDEISSRIVNWNSDQPLNNTLLQAAINDATSTIGVSASSAINYYDFSHPTANKMTLVRESFAEGSTSTTNDFDVTVPGSVLQASWAVACAEGTGSTYTDAASLSFDDNGIARSWGNPFIYGNFVDNYNNNYFTANIDHKITLTRRSDANYYAATATLLIYKTN
jgi:hypothetical protein